MTEQSTIILPVEVQVRELDAKLLLACLGAERGFRVIIGCYAQVNRRLHNMPRSIYIAKAVTEASARVFRSALQLGHAVVAWDEEALVDMSPEFYVRRKTSPEALANAQALFAWGEQNAQTWRTAPGYAGQPLFTNGNPRGDLMRSDLRAYYNPEVEDLRRKFGDFILINSNFGRLNHYRPSETLRLEDLSANVPADKLGTWDDPNMVAYRYALFQAFRELVPQLARRMPGRRIIVRPHPGEGDALWREAASGCPNVEVVGEGSIIPWLMAATAVVHNGCTTGLEAFLLGRPVIAYQPITHPDYDIWLPNALSHSATDIEAVIEALEHAFTGNPQVDETRRRLANRVITSMEGPLASERILDALEDLLAKDCPFNRLRMNDWVKGQLASRRRLLKKAIKTWRVGQSGSSDYVRHRFPDLEVADIERRIARFRMVTQRFDGLQVRKRAHNIFEITHR